MPWSCRIVSGSSLALLFSAVPELHGRRCKRSPYLPAGAYILGEKERGDTMNTKKRPGSAPDLLCYQYISFLLPCTANLSGATIFSSGTKERTEAQFPYKYPIYPYIPIFPVIYSPILLFSFFTVPFVPLFHYIKISIIFY